MTERLYYADAYLTEFDARVESCEVSGNLWRVRLDRSAFYPTSGGQPFDTGALGGARVVDVAVEADEVWHTTDAPLAPGAKVHGKIDWPRRFDHMQQHAGDHMIAGAIHRLLGGVTIGLHVGDEVSTIDVAMPGGVTHLSPDDLRRVEEDVNDHIQRDVPIRCWFPTPDELKSLPLRKPPTVAEHVRVVAIGDDEMVACGGTHPSSAGQLGLVKIVSATPARGKLRVAFLAGRRALNDYFRCFDAAHEAAGRFSTGIDRLTASVDAAQERLHRAEAELNRLRRERLPEQAEALLAEAEAMPGGGRLVAARVELDAGLLRELASKLIERPGVVALLGSVDGERANFTFGRSADVSADMGVLLRKAAASLGGKGGGRPDFAQGSGSPGILDAAREILLGGEG